ncbi:CLUMA_CG000598, isoform A [Clunio marinus]|uniref:CLUMA_CG000598, isoform A n=1 Tax=Clunio marinus TaxID=568069 RepID=A0A1J1HJW9_9DIPT|nr:CLUMA_CG000598, isoform A [Clunio marinus]
MTGLSIDDVRIDLQKFGLPDYSIFVLMLATCAAIGIYFGFFEKKSKIIGDESDYLVGGRNMKTFPVAMSLIASFISGISLLGTPTETYIYGIQYLYIMGGIITMGFIMMYVYLPVFHDLKLTSTYEYLQTRFDKKMRLFGCILFIFSQMVWLPIVIFVPALAFNQVSGIDIHMITPITCVCCIFYTTVGGLKAVVYTDVVQSLMMFGAMFIVIIKGTLDVGGLDVVINRNIESGRIEGPDTSFDLTSRHTVWSLCIGGFVYWLKTNAISQNMIQRYLSLPNLTAAKRALWIFIFGVFVMLSICCYCGLLIYATYHDCDPLTTKLVKAKDQLLPLLVMDILGDYPGLPGLFVAGVFSAALSSLSTGLNSMSAVMLEDFFKPFSKKPLTELQTKYIMRGVVAVFGTICVALVLVVEQLGAVLQLSMSLGAVAQGPLLGIFTMGVMLPWVHGTGAFVGSATALSFMTWICFKAQRAIATGELQFATKEVSTSGCSYHFIANEPMSMLAINETAPTMTLEDIEPMGFQIYHISYLWYTLVGSFICIIVSLIASYILGPNKPSDLNPNLLAPFVRKLIKFETAKPIANDERELEHSMKLKMIDHEEIKLKQQKCDNYLRH